MIATTPPNKRAIRGIVVMDTTSETSMNIRQIAYGVAVLTIQAGCSGETAEQAPAVPPPAMGSPAAEVPPNAAPLPPVSASASAVVKPEDVMLTTLDKIPGRELVSSRGLYCHVLEHAGHGALETLLSNGLATIRHQAATAQTNAVLNVSVSAGSYQSAATSGDAAGFVICGDLAVVR